MINVKSIDEDAVIAASISSPLFLRSTDEAPRLARQFVANWCEISGISDDFATRLVVSELVTNAHRHAGGDVITVRLHLDGRDGAPVVEVWDEGRGRPVRRPENHAAEDGRGLQTVEQLSTEWGVREPVEGGKVVWARVAG